MIGYIYGCQLAEATPDPRNRGNYYNYAFLLLESAFIVLFMSWGGICAS